MSKANQRSRQQAVRQAVRDAWSELLRSCLEPALRKAQDVESSLRIVDALWPDLHVGDLERLDRGDPDFLCCARGVPATFRQELVRLLELESEGKLTSIRETNKYARGSKLTATIEQEVEYRKDDIHREIERVFDRRDTDRLGSGRRVRDIVLRHLNDRCLAELSTSDDEVARRQLKVLAALSTPGGTTQERSKRLRRLTTGATHSFPYVPKYLSRGKIPTIRTFASIKGAFCYGGFTPSLTTLFPESVHVRDCLQRFERRDGILQLLIDPSEPISESLSDAFDELDAYVQREAGGIFMPKDQALEFSRRDGLKMPDGVICAVSLAVLTESVLRQCVTTLGLGGGVNQRPAEIVRRLKEAGDFLKPRTIDLLETLFDSRCLSPRDAMAHGAFFAGSEELLQKTLIGMSQALEYLVQDFSATGFEEAVFEEPRWDDGRAIPPDVLAVIEEQGQPGLNLLDQMSDDEARDHVFRMLDALTPDKAQMGKSAFLLWINGQRLEHEGARQDAVDFAAIYAGLIVLEELWRAVYEVYGERTLITSDQANGIIKCELAILDSRPGHLLEVAAMRRVFGDTFDEEGFLPSINAVRVIRDHVMHDVWSAIQPPYSPYAHLLMKVLFTLCAAVGFRTE